MQYIKFIVPYTIITLLGCYIAYSTPAAIKQWRRDIAVTVAEWPELKALTHDHIEEQLVMAMPTALPMGGLKNAR